MAARIAQNAIWPRRGAPGDAGAAWSAAAFSELSASGIPGSISRSGPTASRDPDDMFVIFPRAAARASTERATGGPTAARPRVG